MSTNSNLCLCLEKINRPKFEARPAKTGFRFGGKIRNSKQYRMTKIQNLLLGAYDSLRRICAVIASEAKQSLEIATSLKLLAMTALHLSKQTILCPPLMILTQILSRSFENSNFVFVSDFEIRISDLVKLLLLKGFTHELGSPTRRSNSSSSGVS